VLPLWLVNGGDLIKAGFEPGPELGKALTAVQNAQLDGVVTTREEALAWVAENTGRMPGSHDSGGDA